MDAERLRILLVDDERSLREPLAKFLTYTHGFEVHAVADGPAALAEIEAVAGEFDVALIDRLLLSEVGEEEMDGIEVMRQLRARYPAIESIIFTGWGQEERQRALEHGAFRYLEKPFDNDELAMHIRVAAQQVRLRAISQDILSNLDLTQVLPRIAAAARSLTQADAALIALIHSASGELRPHQSDALLGERLTWEQFATETDLHRLVRTGQYRSVTNLSVEAWAAPGTLDLGFLSYVGTPIPGPGGNLGALLVLSRHANHFDASGHIALLQTLAGQAALAITNARSYQEKETRARHMEALVKVGQALTRTDDLEEQLQLAWGFARRQLDANTFVVALHDRVGDLIEFPIAFDQGVSQSLPAIRYGEALRAGIIEYVIHTGQERCWSTSDERQRDCARLDIEPIPHGAPCESCFFFPLMVGAEVIGVLSVQSYDPYAFSPVMLDVCRALGNQLAVAITNARLLGNTRRKASDLTTLLRFSVGVGDSLDLRRVMTQACEAAVKVFGAEHSGLVLFDDDGQRGTVQAEFPPGLTPVGTSIEVRGVPAEERLLGGETLVIDRVADQHDLGPVRSKMLDRFNIQSTVIAPIQFRGKVVGSFSVDAVGRTRRFGPDEETLSRLLAAQVAVAMEHAQLYGQAEDRGRLLQALEQASRHIRAVKEPDRLLSEIVRLAVELMRCSAGYLFVNDPYRAELTLTATYGAEQLSPRTRVNHGMGLLGKALESRKPEPCADYAGSPYVDPLFARYHFRSALATPLLSDDGTDAVLFLAVANQRRVWKELDLDIIARFTGQAAIALQASRAITAEQRALHLQKMLHMLSDYMQAANDRARILRVILTGVTAGWSLGFNRAALLLLDETGEALVGEMGVGHVDEVLQHDDWERDVANGDDQFDRFQARLEIGDLPTTPINERIQGLVLPLGRDDVFARVLREKRYVTVNKDDRPHLPPAFEEVFEPAFPLVVAPLVARDRTIGLLVADNRFTRLPITESLCHSLMTFANTAAVAIANIRNYEYAQSSSKWLRSYFEASQIPAYEPDLTKSLRQIVERARQVTQADAVAMALMDEKGRPEKFLVVPSQPADIHQVVRSDGLSTEILRSRQPVSITDTAATRHPISRSNFWRGFRAALGLPIIREDEAIGVMWFLFVAPRPFPEAEIDAIQLFVNQAAIAHETSQRLEELTRMREATLALTQQGSARETLPTIAEGARLVLRAESVFIWSYDRSHNRFIPGELIVAGNVPTAEVARLRHMEPAPGQTTATIMERRYLSVENVVTAPIDLLGQPTRELFGRLGIRSFQAVSLVAGDRPLGVLYANYPEPRSFGSRDRESIETFAGQASTALNRARVQDQLRRTHKAAAGVAEAVVQQDLDRTLSAVAATARRALEADVVTVYAFDEIVGRLTTMGQDFADRSRKAHSRPPAYVSPESVIHTILRLDSRPHYLTTDTPAERQQLLQGVFVKREGIRASAGIQLHNRNHKVGVMFVNYHTDHSFSREEMHTIQLFANNAAAAIVNHQRFEALDKARRMVDARTKIATMSLIAGHYFHRVSTNAEAIRKWVDELRHDLGSAAPAVDEHLGGIRRAADDIRDLPVDVPLSPDEGVEVLPVNDIFRSIWATIAKKEVYRAVIFDLMPLVTPDVAIQVNPVWLQRLVELLAQNATRAMEHQPNQRLRLTLEEKDGFVMIRIQDNGPGIPEAYATLIFNEPIPKASPLSGERPSGLGFGCLFAQLIVQTYGGDIRVEQTSAQGTTILFWLPAVG